MSSSAPPSVGKKPSTPPPPGPGKGRSPVRWLVGALAAAVVVVAAVASAVLWSGEDDQDSASTRQASPPAASADPGQVTPSQGTSGRGTPSAGPSGGGQQQTSRPLELTVKPQQGRCLLPSADRLKSAAALAFEGTVATIDARSRTAVVDVSKWLYADGFGGTDTVRIQLPQAGTESTPTFRRGHTYLVAADGQGEVMGCGFTGERSGDLTTLYGRAFV